MANSKIVKYLKDGLKKGYSIEALQNQLINYGFKEHDVIYSVKEAMNPTHAKPKSSQNSSISVKIISVLLLVFSFVGIAQSLFLFFGRGLFSVIPIPLSSSAFIISGVLLLIFSSFILFVGIKLYELKDWARIAVLILSWIVLALSVFSFFVFLISVGVFDFFYFLMSLAFAFLVWHFQFDKRTVSLFKGSL